MIENQLIVLLSYTDWEFPCDFEKQTARWLSRNNRVIIFTPLVGSPLYKIFFDSDMQHLIKRDLATLKTSLQFFPVLYPFPFHRLEFVAVINKWLVFISLLLYVFWQSKKLKRTPIFWTFSPESADIVSMLQRFFRKFRLVYDCVDFHASIIRSENKKIALNEKKLLEVVDVVFVNSHTLYETKHTMHPNVHKVPQGFDVELFLDIPKTSCPEVLRKIKHPIVGFVGVIDHRLDFDLLIDIAISNQDMSFVFVGPRGQAMMQDAVYHVSKKIRLLKRLLNVHFLDEQPKSRIASYMDQFDICMIPYRIVEDFNRYSFPMKTLEYFARGKPVVATAVEELSQFSPYIKIATTPKGWTRQIKQLLGKTWPKSYQRQQQIIARMNSWEHKIRAMSRYLA